MIGERLAEARRRAGLAQVDLAVALGDRYDQPMISNVERDRRNLRFDGAVKAAQELGVSLDYLAGLTDDPTPPTGRSGANDDMAGTRTADDDQKESLEHLAEVAAAAGIGSETYNETVTDTVPFRRSWLRQHRLKPAHCHIISVRGQSMEPTLPDGCSIIVDRSRRELRQGRIYLMRTEEGLVVKRVKKTKQGWWLMSDNPEWPPLFLSEETDIIGEVRWAARSF